MSGVLVHASAWVEKTTADTTVNLPIHASAVAGDRVVAGWTVNSATLMAAQTGFTTIEELASTGDTLAPACAMFRKLLTAADITNGFVTLDSIPSGVGSGGAVVLQGYTTTQDFTVVQLDKTETADGNFAFGDKAISMAGVVGIYLCAQNTVQAGTFTPAASFTEVGDRVAGRNASMGYRIFPASGQSGAITPVSSQPTRGVGLLVGFQPSAAAPSNNAKFAAFL